MRHQGSPCFGAGHMYQDHVPGGAPPAPRCSAYITHRCADHPCNPEEPGGRQLSTPAARSRARSREWSPDTHGWSAGGHSSCSQGKCAATNAHKQFPSAAPAARCQSGASPYCPVLKVLAFPVGLQERLASSQPGLKRHSQRGSCLTAAQTLSVWRAPLTTTQSCLTT